eukprot:10260846-Alexandrium_andersonii.AAC.1
MEAKFALLQVPEPHRCGAARHYAWHAGKTYAERLNLLQRVCTGVIGVDDLYHDQDCLLYLLPSSVKGS